jgi:hypothetical protein
MTQGTASGWSFANPARRLKVAQRSFGIVRRSTFRDNTHVETSCSRPLPCATSWPSAHVRIAAFDRLTVGRSTCCDGCGHGGATRCAESTGDSLVAGWQSEGKPEPNLPRPLLRSLEVSRESDRLE